MLKSHKKMLGSRYFNITTIIIPLAFILIGTVVRFIFGNVEANFFLSVQAWLMIYEISTEYFGFGPIYRKNNFGMEYLKTSVIGMDFVKKSMLTDSFIRIVRTFAYTFLPAIFVLRSIGDPKTLLIYALVLANVSVWSVTFTRFVSMYGFLLLVAMPVLLIGIILDAVGMLVPSAAYPLMVIAVLLLAGGVVFTQKFAEKKIKASYYDLR
ncbi:hypothetical protein SAMN02910292_01081 [Lachnospiraceae bacterium XBB2008]|nr:hypothetical protein SAMN02910292_01081 [Lachnospiraceae bacterium XBB2008]